MQDMTYSGLRENLATVWDKVEDDSEPVMIKRRGHKKMVMMPASEYRGLKETIYLLSNRANAQILTESLQQSEDGDFVEVDL